MTTELKPGERLDDLQRNGYKIIQDPGRFCFGMDAVLLSGFARVKKGERAADLGTGTGIIPILLRGKTEGSYFAGLEIQEESADMARRSVAYNSLEDSVEIVTGDIKEAVRLFGPASFDVVTSNPPYMTGQHGLTNPNEARAIARHEILFRLAEIFGVLGKYKLEPKRMRLVYPYMDREPNMVLIEACKGGRPRITVEKPLIVYQRPGVYTDEIYDVYGY